MEPHEDSQPILAARGGRTTQSLRPERPPPTRMGIGIGEVGKTQLRLRLHHNLRLAPDRQNCSREVLSGAMDAQSSLFPTTEHHQLQDQRSYRSISMTSPPCMSGELSISPHFLMQWQLACAHVRTFLSATSADHPELHHLA